MNNSWKFSEINCIEEFTFNKVLENFSKLGVSALVKENIQNSLDARLSNDNRVIVNIEIGQIHKSDIPGLDQIKNRIGSLKGKNSYTRNTIDTMRSKMNEELVDYISFEDINTKGLKYTESMNGEKKDTWSVYAYHKGNHAEDSDEVLEKSRGGSYGVGKIASNAASDLHMMYFASCDDEGNQLLGGTVQLIEHQYDDNYYRASGYFTDQRELVNGKFDFVPYKNTYHKVFQKSTRGLKIIVPFLKEQLNDEKAIIQCICDNFFIAILKGKLQVNVNGKELSENELAKYIKNDEYYEQVKNQIKDNFTPLYYNTYLNCEPRTLVVKDMKDKHEFHLYFNYDEEITKGRVAIVRTIGMKIEDFKVSGNATKPFNAVIVPVTTEEDMFLKSLENESHTKISFEHITDTEVQKNAKRFINNLSKEIIKIIDESIRLHNKTDGWMDTEDIIYDMKMQFKNDLEKSMPSVHVINGKKKIVQIGGKKKNKKDDKLEGINVTKTEGEKKSSTSSKTRKTRVKDEESSGEETKAIFSAHPSEVERVILGSDELIRFDFSGNSELSKTNKCNLSLAVVDGMGDVMKDKFRVEENYQYAIDPSAGQELTIRNNKIEGVNIKKGIIQLNLKLKDRFNKALKFVYFVEV